MKLNKSSAETLLIITEVNGDYSLSGKCVIVWQRRFSEGIYSVAESMQCVLTIKALRLYENTLVDKNLRK